MCPQSASCFAWSNCWANSIADGHLVLQLWISQRAGLNGRENAKFLRCTAASEKGMSSLTSSLLLDQHIWTFLLPCLPVCAGTNWVCISRFTPCDKQLFGHQLFIPILSICPKMSICWKIKQCEQKGLCIFSSTFLQWIGYVKIPNGCQDLIILRSPFVHAAFYRAVCSAVLL